MRLYSQRYDFVANDITFILKESNKEICFEEKNGSTKHISFLNEEQRDNVLNKILNIIFQNSNYDISINIDELTFERI